MSPLGPPSVWSLIHQLRCSVLQSVLNALNNGWAGSGLSLKSYGAVIPDQVLSTIVHCCRPSTAMVCHHGRSSRSFQWQLKFRIRQSSHVVDCVKSSGQVEQRQQRQVTVVHCTQNVSQYFQNDNQNYRLRQVVNCECTL